MYFENLIQKIKLPFRKDKELYLCLYHILGFYPNNISYYKQALMHKSVSVKGKDGRYLNNERLEFLGDAILDAVVGDVVYRHFENKREGFLTNARSKLVQRETLGKLAVEIGLDKLIQFNQQHTNSHNSYMAGNAFEALVGAIYLDYGYDRCMKFMEKRILNHVIDVDKTAYKEVNFKSKLLEWSQKNRIRLDFKDLHQGVDKDGAHVFNTLVVIEGLDCGRGKGYSKKESQQRAAQETLIMLKKQKGFEESVFEAKSRRTAMEEQPEALLPEIPDEVLTAELKSDAPQKSNRSEQSSNKKEQSAAKKEQQPAGKKEQQPAGKKEQQPAGKKEQQNSVSEPANEQVASDFSFDSVNVGLKKSTLPVEQTSEADSSSAPKSKKQVNSDKKSEKPAADKKNEKPADKKSEKPADKKNEKPADKKSEKPAGKKSEKPAADKKSEKPVVDKTDEQSVATDKAEETDKKEQKAKPARKPRAKKTASQSEDNTAQQAEPANAEVPSDIEKDADAEQPVGAETKSNAENAAGAEPSADAEKKEKKPSSRRRRKPAAEKAVEKASEDEATGEAEKSVKAEVVEKPAKPIDANSVKKPAKPVETDLAKAEVVEKPVEPSAAEAAPASDTATDAVAPAKPKRRGSRRRSSSLGSATHTSN